MVWTILQEKNVSTGHLLKLEHAMQVSMNHIHCPRSDKYIVESKLSRSHLNCYQDIF